MNRDDIIRLAEKAGLFDDDQEPLPEYLERFAELVAAAEREACCSIVYGQCGSDNVAQRTVDAIRARSE
jgi:hypothetical protein